ncbi:hypothetical protein BGZ68_004872 [Mortierella alpina]|nr:hypothetical protein BGZ68_004872 [Mortierella alpina]
MAQPPHPEQHLHDSEYTSDSNDEFASASEGDDDLPWEPVVLRSPMVSQQSPQLAKSNESTPRPSRAVAVSDHTQEQLGQQEEHPARAQQQQQQQRVIQAPPQKQQQQQHDQWHQAFDSDVSKTISSSSWTSRTSYPQSSQPHSNQHAPSFSTTTTQVQTSSTPTRSRSTPKLRERVRQSPVLHSRIVRAYLDPNASSAQQHASPEFVREAWLQEHQETQRESSEEEEEESAQDHLPNQRVPSLTPLQSYHHPAPVSVTAPVVSPSSDPLMTTAAHTDMLEVDDSWGFDDTLNIEETAQEDQEEFSQTFDEPTVVPEEAPSAHLSAVVPDLRYSEGTTTSMIHQDQGFNGEEEDAWGGDDQLMDLVEADIHSTLAAQPIIHEEVQHVQQDGWTQQQHDDEYKSAQVRESIDEYELEHGSKQLHESDMDAYTDEIHMRVAFPTQTAHADRNPFMSPEDDLHQSQGIASDLQLSSAQKSHSSDISRPEDTVSVELLDHMDSEAAWYEGEVFEQSSAHEVLQNAVMEEILDKDTQPEPEVASPGYRHEDPSLNSQSKDDIPMGSDSEEAEASWGFDMDQVIDIEAYPIEDAPIPQMGFHDNTVPSTDNTERRDPRDQETVQVDAPQFLPQTQDAPLAQESFQVEHSTIIPEQEVNQHVQGSDDENDSEVREIMQAAQHNPFIGSDDCLQTDQSSVALSSIISDSELVVDNEDIRTPEDAAQLAHPHDEKPFLQNAPVMSHLSIMQDPLPEPLDSAPPNNPYDQEESSSNAQDLGGAASDSEGSDIYGDLSTARSGINASSNRLNEILDDDDYLEHMERGVPMNRSISTPYSDDDSPKFIVEDEIVELMERGEPQRLDAASLELHVDQDDNSDDTSFAAHQMRSPSPAPVSNIELDIPLGTAPHDDGIESFDLETQTPLESSTEVAAENSVIDSLETAAPISTPLDILETALCIDTPQSAEEPFMAPLAREEAHEVEAVTTEGSDEQDPANPFSDAAAVDTKDESWPVKVHPIGTPSLDQSGDIYQENADESEYSVNETANQDSWPEPSLVESHLDVEVQEDDAWAEQDLDIVMEAAPPVSSSLHTEIPPSDVFKPEIPAMSDSDEQPTLKIPEPTVPTLSVDMGGDEDSEEDAWGADAHQPLDDMSSAVHAESERMPEATHTLMESSMSAQRDLHKDEHVDEFQRHYSPLLPTDVPKDQVSDRAWSGNDGVDTVANVTEEGDAWSGNDEIHISEAPLYNVQADLTGAPSALEEKEELPAAQEPSFAVDTQINDAIRDVHPSSYFDGTTLAERSSETTELGAVIDEALDGDGHIIAESTAADAGLSKAEIESGLPVEVFESDQQPDPSTTHTSVEQNNTVDNWSEEDAWNDEDIDLSPLTPKHEAGPPTATESYEEDHIGSLVTEPTITMTVGASNAITDPGFHQSIDTALDNDAWLDQDLNVDVAIETQPPFVETVRPPSDIRETAVDGVQVEVGHAIHSDLKEDLWSDHDLDLTIQDVELPGLDPRTTRIDDNEEYQETADHASTGSILETHESLTDAGEEVLLKFTQSVIDSASELTSAISSAQPADDTLLDSALDEDAWADQDVNIESDLTDEGLTLPHVVPSPHVDKVQDERLDVKSEVRPSSILRVGSIIHSTTSSDERDEVVEDAWGWDEDGVGVHLEIEKETPPPSAEETMTLADDTNVGSPIEQDLDELNFSHHGHADASTEPSSESTTSHLQGTTHSLLPAHGATHTTDRLSPLSIHKEGVISGTDSGEGDEDSTNASQSPWQDVSPASVSKRSEAGMSIGSEFESEYSIQSLDDDEHTSSSQAETKTPVETSMSWTSLHTDGWQSDSHGSSSDLHGEDKSDQPAPSGELDPKASQPTLEIQDLPDISGADSWDFDQDDHDDLQSDLMAFKQEHSTVAPSVKSTRDLKTPDMDEHTLFAQQHPVHSTPLGEQELSSQRTSIAGSLPVSPSQPQTPSTPSVAAPITNEVEDDSHLPLAIRQQRARLAAKGKPLPPISKYNSVKDKGASADQTLSPRLSATSPVSAFASPVKTPLSPMLKATSPSTPAASSSPAATATAYLSPALQKQRERLEQKRAAAAAAAATPLSAARRLTVTETPATLSTQLHGKPTSPLLSSKALPSALKNSLSSPSLTKKTVQLAGLSEPQPSLTPLASPTSLAEESKQLSSRRRGSSAAPLPTSPLAEGFVRRSKDGSRPSVKPAAGFASDTVVRTSQSDTHRPGSWLSNSSAQSGWDETFDDDDHHHQDQLDHDSGSKVSTSIAAKDRKEPPVFSSATSSSFYQQTVPGLDDDDRYGAKASKTTTTTTSTTTISTPPALTSSYLSSKKADDYDAYGPMNRKSGKSKSSMEDSSESVMADHSNETLIGGSTMSAKTNISLLSPTSATSMSHRHDHHHGHHSSSTTAGGAGSGGFFAGGGNSLVGDISSILSEKAAAQGNTTVSGSGSGSGSYDSDHNKKPPSSNLQKSSSWSFGSWVSSAVAVASEKIDKAYETLDPEYSRMKSRGGSSTSTAMGDGLPDPESTSPFKKPGYVVGGSSLALGLASISTGPSVASSSQAPQQQRQQHHHHASPPASATPAGLGFGSRGGHGSGVGGFAASDSQAQQQHESHAPEQRMPDWEREHATSPRLTRKNVSGR